MDPMPGLQSAATRHYETCKPEESNGSRGSNVQDYARRNSDSGDGRNHSQGGGVQQRGNSEVGIQASRSDAQGAGQVARIKMYGVNDPNHQLLAVGYEPVDGVLVCQFKTAKWSYAGVPEAEFLKLKKVPFAYRIFTTNIKNRYPATKLS